jgi:hypothetical protein
MLVSSVDNLHRRCDWDGSNSRPVTVSGKNLQFGPLWRRKLVTKQEKEKLDEWYVRNASLGLDLQIAMITIKLLLRGRVPLRKFWLIQNKCKARITA